MRSQNRLTDVKVRREREPGVYPDGAGLHLQVTSSDAKSWIFRFMLNRRDREMGLGPYPLISVTAARQRRDEARRVLTGIDPIEHRKADRDRRRLEQTKQITFKGKPPVVASPDDYVQGGRGPLPRLQAP